MKLLIYLMLIACSGASSTHAEPPKPTDWLSSSSKIPANLATKKNEIAQEQFYECRITMLGVAIDRLRNSEFIELSDDLARDYAGHSYRSLPGRKVYLVRGVFANYTGEFHLYLDNGAMLVQHLSLGSEAKAQFCPLIVQISTPPKKLFIQIGGAQ